jgi:hypothetical protein
MNRSDRYRVGGGVVATVLERYHGRYRRSAWSRPESSRMAASVVGWCRSVSMDEDLTAMGEANACAARHEYPNTPWFEDLTDSLAKMQRWLKDYRESDKGDGSCG